jgi:hypothetical protein
MNYAELRTKETLMEPMGEVEIETSYTTFSDLQFQHVLEANYALTDLISVEAMLRGGGESTGTAEYNKASVELKHSFLSEDDNLGFGAAWVGEVVLPTKTSDFVHELEAKLILDKAFGYWVTSVNVGVESETEKDSASGKRETQNRPVYSLGVAYNLPKSTLFVNYNATAGDEDERVGSIGFQSKLSRQFKLGVTYAKGFTNEVPDSAINAAFEYEF